jgi:DNA-binding CsgD family transcriptional regulator
VLGASYQLARVRDPAELRAAIAQTLGGLIPNDVTGWVSWSPRPPRILARWPENESAKRALGQHVETLRHPVLRAIRAGRGGAPIRLSDLVGDDRRHPVVADLHRVMGARYQLTFPAAPVADGVSSTWALHRASVDFSAAELDLATRLAPLLSLLDRGLWPVISIEAPTGLLTAREAQILTMLARGMTTAQIGYAERISARTVGKHIEHVYSKLDVHDRVSAARAARRLGLID